VEKRVEGLGKRSCTIRTRGNSEGSYEGGGKSTVWLDYTGLELKDGREYSGERFCRKW